MSIPVRLSGTINDPSSGSVSFDAMAPLGSPLHVTGLWSAESDDPPVRTIPLLTSSREECIPPLIRKPFAWRDLYRRSLVLVSATGNDHGYHRPSTMKDWVGVQEDLSKAGEETSSRGRILMSLLPVGLLFVVMPLAHFLPIHTVLRTVLLFTTALASVAFGYAGMLPFACTGYSPGESKGLDGQYQPAGYAELVDIKESRKKFPCVEAAWNALSLHSQETDIPILKGDLGYLNSIKKFVFTRNSTKNSHQQSSSAPSGATSLDPAPSDIDPSDIDPSDINSD